MTADGPASHASGEATGDRTQGLPAATLIELCDGLLGEIARRSHCFAWLRTADAGTEEWLAVDAYYPANRLVVVCRAAAGPDDQLFAERVPAHGLRLLTLVPATLGADRTAAQESLRRSLSELQPPPPPMLPDEPAVTRALAALAQPPARAVAVLSGRPAQAVAALTQPKPARVALGRRAGTGVPAGRSPAPGRRSVPRGLSPAPHARRSVPRGRSPGPGAPTDQDAVPPARSAWAELPGVLAGVVLAAILCAEIYLAVGTEALGAGRVLLGSGLLLDAGARALGTLAAERAGRPVWAWGCVIGGSPVVAVFALYRPDGPEPVDPAPLAGLLSLLAIGIIALSILFGA
jgi:hypothetical protein